MQLFVVKERERLAADKNAEIERARQARLGGG
jgi:hypothetical protein